MEEREVRLRRWAVQIVSELPEDPEEALRVLGLATSLIENFVANGWFDPPTPQPAEVLRFRLAAGSGGEGRCVSNSGSNPAA